MGLTLDFEWWQLWTCHLAHWDVRHLLLNVLASLPPLVLVPRRAAARLLLSFFAAAPLLSWMLIASGALRGEYRGASGLVVALWFFAALELLRNGERIPGGILLAAVSLKVLAEMLGLWPAQSDTFASMPAAHVAGALTGMMAAIAWSRGRSRQRILPFPQGSGGRDRPPLHSHRAAAASGRCRQNVVHEHLRG